MRPAWWLALLAACAAGASALWPLSPAVSADAMREARGVSGLLAVAGSVAVALSRRVPASVWNVIAGVSGLAALLLLGMHLIMASSCVATYDGRPLVIGRALLPHAAEYARRHPGSSPSDLLFDAGGVPERVWTPASIRSCQLGLTWGALFVVPLLTLALGSMIARRASRISIAHSNERSTSASVSAHAEPRYDAFISYRHVEPDRTTALDLYERLQARGFRVALDDVSFRPNEQFLPEMERCIKESRFTLCVVTRRYLESDHCVEEATIIKTLDMAERRRRLVPLIFERVELPVWLHGLVGIDFTASARVDPEARLLALLQQGTASDGAR